MGQVTIGLEDELEAKMVADAKARKFSQSKWIANVIREKLARMAVCEAAGVGTTFPRLRISGTKRTTISRWSWPVSAASDAPSRSQQLVTRVGNDVRVLGVPSETHRRYRLVC